MNHSADNKLIDVTTLPLGKVSGAAVKALRWPVESLLGARKLNRIYRESLADVPTEEIWTETARALGLEAAYGDDDLYQIPESGPLVMIANHPFGGADGILLMEMLLRRRKDVKVLANEVLRSIPQMTDSVIPVDVYSTGNRMKNARNIQKAIRHTKEGGALLVFPAGAVAHFKLNKMKFEECEWSAHVGTMIRKAKATVIPVHVHGRNSLTYQILGSMNATLRSLMLIREMLNKNGRCYRVDVGSPIPWSRLDGFPGDAELMDYLKDTVAFIRDRQSSKKLLSRSPGRTVEPQLDIIKPLDREVLQAEIRSLPETSFLVARGDYSVYVARAPQIPNVMQELGRLREISYREVDEGTGTECDLDRFDEHYLHLFVWDHGQCEVAGAYRLGLVDRILIDQGKKGLYTNTLFRYKKEFLNEISDAIELGRSFIQPKYQESFGVLPLLWKGICLFAVKNPRYRKLFGGVSISNGYKRRSRNLMVQFLKTHNCDPFLARKVKARTPYRVKRNHRSIKRLVNISARDMSDVSMAISSVEKDNKGIPILIKHYLKLQAQFLSFNLDRSFSDVVDGLILVNLDHSNERMIRHYMGAEGFDAFRSCGEALAG